MAGEGEIAFAESDLRAMRLEPGDTVYIPAGVPSRLTPHGENLQVRLKAEPAVREAVAWYCARCGALVHSDGAARRPPPGGLLERGARLQRRARRAHVRRVRRGPPAGQISATSPGPRWSLRSGRSEARRGGAWGVG